MVQEPKGILIMVIQLILLYSVVSPGLGTPLWMIIPNFDLDFKQVWTIFGKHDL